MGCYGSVAISVNLCMGLCVGYWGSVAVGQLRWVGSGGLVAVGWPMCWLVAMLVPWVGCRLVAVGKNHTIEDSSLEKKFSVKRGHQAGS